MAVKFQCPFCSAYMQTARFDNGEGRCRECDAVIAETEKHPLNPVWAMHMKKKFDNFSTDGAVNRCGHSTLDFREMSALIKQECPRFTSEGLIALFAEADTNGNGVIEFSEFLWFLHDQAHPAAPIAIPSCCTAPCPLNNGGPHAFKFGLCRYCHACEGKMLHGSGAVANPGGRGGCQRGGKCMFKYGRCRKCHHLESTF